ncbi:MAG: Rrf2 family transcriptional regulator [Spirochaetaceae bacterium]|jgi:Rrf2 family protein|nr:Rrf2 family transcriptional regulator [Spirochaetaceae bacterium]
MKISTRGRYGTRLLIDLAEHLDESHVSLASAAERQGISLRYLEQLAVILKRAGFIRSVKGASGGYVLARPPEEIVLGDVLRVLEGDMLVADPAENGAKETKLQRCIRLLVLDKLNSKIAQVIENKTLASVAGAGHETYMYYI